MESTLLKLARGLELLGKTHVRLGATRPVYVDECRQARRAHSLPLFPVCGLRKLGDIQGIIDDSIAGGISVFRKRD